MSVSSRENCLDPFRSFHFLGRKVVVVVLLTINFKKKDHIHQKTTHPHPSIHTKVSARIAWVEAATRSGFSRDQGGEVSTRRCQSRELRKKKRVANIVFALLRRRDHAKVVVRSAMMTDKRDMRTLEHADTDQFTSFHFSRTSNLHLVFPATP
jgi:hypothetical protein